MIAECIHKGEENVAQMMRDWSDSQEFGFTDSMIDAQVSRLSKPRGKKNKESNNSESAKEEDVGIMQQLLGMLSEQKEMLANQNNVMQEMRSTIQSLKK
jgi:hypothetical protein